VAELLPDEVLPPRRRHPEPELGFSPPADSLALDIWNDRKFHYLLYLVNWTLSLIYSPNLIRQLGLATPCLLAHIFVCVYVCMCAQITRTKTGPFIFGFSSSTLCNFR
jgi:hypothetical protein